MDLAAARPGQRTVVAWLLRYATEAIRKSIELHPDSAGFLREEAEACDTEL